LRSYADLRADRLAEINTQISDLLSFFGAIVHMNTGARERTMELLTVTQDFAILLEQQAKHFCWSPRPFHIAPEVFPIIQTPDHSSFPSGHAVESFALATVVHRLMTKQDAKSGLAERAIPFRIAHRATVNRTIAGVHYPVDNAAGALIGIAIGEALYAMGGGGEPLQVRSFHPGKTKPWFEHPEHSDFTLQGLCEFLQLSAKEDPVEVPHSKLWAKHWSETVKCEWR